MNYIVRGLFDLKYAIMIGIPVYAIFFLLMYALKKRKGISWKCAPEMVFCVYCVLLVKLVGIFSLHFSFDGIMSYNLIPFIGSSFFPVMLNFVLFVPYGLLLPVVFASCKWDCKKILCVSALTSLIIEFFQMFGGRYAEIDDFLINTLGAFSGYIIYVCVHESKKDRQKAVAYFLSLCIAIIIAFMGIYVVGDNGRQSPDGLYAVESNITEINVYSGGEERRVGVDSEVYHRFTIQLNNCGGHVLEARSIAESDIWNGKDCFIEVIYNSPQTIVFDNSANFTIEKADRILYNADRNILYWGNSYYQNCLDYTELDVQLTEHRSDILAQYHELQEVIIQYFE